MPQTRRRTLVSISTLSAFIVSVSVPVFAPTSNEPRPLAVFALNWASGTLITSPFDIHSVFDYTLVFSLLSTLMTLLILRPRGRQIPQCVLASVSVPVVAIAAYEFVFQTLNWAMFRQPQFIFQMPYFPIFLAWLAMAANILPYSGSKSSLPAFFLVLVCSAFGLWILEGFHQIYSGNYVVAWAMNILSKASTFCLLVSILELKRD